MLYKVLRGVSTKDVGLCILVADLCDENTRKHILQMLKEAIATWPEHSGNSEYPVDAPAGFHTPMSAYMALRKWGATPYGRARRRLLWHCIAWCEAAMAE